MEDKTRHRTSGIDRAIQIMDILTERQQPMSAYDIARSVGAPLSTVYRIVEDLVAREMLSRANETLVWLGPRLMRYGLLYRAQIDFFAEAKREMVRLAKETGETVQICTRDEGMMVVIGMAEGDGHFRVASNVGTRVPLNWTASGRLLLGHLGDRERLAAFTKYSRPSHTEIAETDPVRLSEQSREDYTRRLSVQTGASEFAVACIAAPIRNADGSCLATISIVISDRQAADRGGTLSTAVKQSALNIERALGH